MIEISSPNHRTIYVWILSPCGGHKSHRGCTINCHPCAHLSHSDLIVHVVALVYYLRMRRFLIRFTAFY